MATEAGGTHPTGMHSCLFLWLPAVFVMLRSVGQVRSAPSARSAVAVSLLLPQRLWQEFVPTAALRPENLKKNLLGKLMHLTTQPFFYSHSSNWPPHFTVKYLWQICGIKMAVLFVFASNIKNEVCGNNWTCNGALILDGKRKCKRHHFRPVALLPICVFILQLQQQWQRSKKKIIFTFALV